MVLSSWKCDSRCSSRIQDFFPIPDQESGSRIQGSKKHWIPRNTAGAHIKNCDRRASTMKYLPEAQFIFARHRDLPPHAVQHCTTVPWFWKIVNKCITEFMLAAQHCRLVHKKYLPLGVASNREWQFSLETCRVRSRISWKLQLQGPFQNILLHTQEKPSSPVWCRLPELGRLVQDILTQFLLLPSRQVGRGQLSVGCTDQPDQMDVGRHYTKKILASLGDLSFLFWVLNATLKEPVMKYSKFWTFWFDHDLITGFNLHSVADPGSWILISFIPDS